MKIRKFQEGGAMPVQEAPMGGEQPMEQDPLMQLAQLFAQGLESGDCEALAAGAEAFLQIIQEIGGGQGPVGEPMAEPVFKKGGKIKKKAAEGTGIAAAMKRHSNIKKKPMAEGKCK